MGISIKLNDLRKTNNEAKEVDFSSAEHLAAYEPAAKEKTDDGKIVLRTENLVKKYRQRTVVNHVSINVTQGEIVGLLGPNGAGKTTTFYMTVGLITPNEGEISPYTRGLRTVSDILLRSLRYSANSVWKTTLGQYWR